LLSRRTAATGIDLGHHAVKVVRLEAGNGKPVLTHWGIEEVEPEDEPAILSRARALRAVLRRLDLKPRLLGRTVTAIGGPDVHVRQVVVPPLSEGELRQALPFEARKHLPLESVPDPCLDFQILGAPAPRNGGDATQDVLLVAAPRSRRDALIRILAEVGIDPDAVDAEPLPAVNAIVAAHGDLMGEDRGLMVLDLGARGGQLAAVQPDGGIYVRRLELPANGASPGPASGDAAASLCQELEESIRFVSLRQRKYAVARVFVCGGRALASGLTDRICRTLGLDVEIPDPLRPLEMGTETPPAAEDRVRLVTAVGLAGW
jgi:Tfp pilus assembly PilM family ATPase